MKIAMVSYNLFPVGGSPSKLPAGRVGAIERIVGIITDGLVDRGHEVTLFAAGDSQTKAKLIPLPELATYHHPLLRDDRLSQIDFEYFLLSQAAMIINAGDFDIVHTHMFERSALFAPFFHKPVVSTLHTVNTRITDIIMTRYGSASHFIAISESQRNLMPYLSYAATIYHGIDTKTFSFSEQAENHIGFMGRGVEEKGPHLAVQVARELRKPLVLATTIRENFQAQFDREAKPFIDGTMIRIVGNITPEEIPPFYQKARLLLFPIQWEVPFGLVMAEAMSCGTPVVVFARGSAPEIVKDGVTGFLVNPSKTDIRGNYIVKTTGLDGLKEAVSRIYALPDDSYRQMRMACRKHIEERFSVSTMLQAYEDVYSSLVKPSI